jgi:type VI protein secretion system component VasA
LAASFGQRAELASSFAATHPAIVGALQAPPTFCADPAMTALVYGCPYMTTIMFGRKGIS